MGFKAVTPVRLDNTRGWPVLNNLSLFQPDYTVAHGLDHIERVCDTNHGLAGVPKLSGFSGHTWRKGPDHRGKNAFE
jgi:hypothetical protein